MTSVIKVLEEEGYDVDDIMEKVKDTVRKCIITIEPYLLNYYRIHISKKHVDDTKAFHVIGMDVLIDKKSNAWIMEINANPSLNIFLEREIPGSTDG
jgi:hypothetical protein